ncbi:dynein regulatory complex protein 8 [Engraulis encrasicolus]|uniref:dynein regulatory complex protein 8 n=1 Tax=Engraulis encrasicolus TaxID=184585 RepID=UPI002FCEE808
MADDKENAEAILAEVHKKISGAFDVFDHEFNKTVDVREIGTIIRSLGCFPSEAELHDVIAEVEEEEPMGYIRYEKFLPVMTRVLMERKFRPIAEDLLLQAFEVLDIQKKGHLEPEELTKYMTQEGEPFTQEEMEIYPTATQQLPNSYRELPNSYPTATRGLPNSYPTATEGYPTATRGLPNSYSTATESYPTATEGYTTATQQLPNSYRELPNSYPTATQQQPRATQQLPRATQQLPMATQQLPNSY